LVINVTYYRPSAALFNAVLYFKRVCLVLLIFSFEGAETANYVHFLHHKQNISTLNLSGTF